MKTRFFTLLISMALVFAVTACSGRGVHTNDPSINREIILKNDYTNEERNLLLTEDILFLKEKLPRQHKELFSMMPEEEFNSKIDQLLGKIDELNNKQVFVELNKTIASIGDAHTTINYWDGYSYPLKFWIFDGKVYIVNAGSDFEKMMFSQVLKIDGMDIKIVIEQLTSLISHENDSWVLAMLPNYLQSPVYMHGLGIVQNESEAIFTVQKNGEEQDITVSALEYGKSVNFVNHKNEDILVGKYDKYYDYEYLPAHKALCFEYNVCADMEQQSFIDFNKKMFDFIDVHDVEKVIVDLRNNSGGDSEILNPFTERLKHYTKDNAGVKVYILVGRNTFSSGMIALYRVKEAVPKAVSVGEPTGGVLDCYGEVQTIHLPNSQIPIGYSTKYFEFSKNFSYKNDGVGTFQPDISIQPTIEEYKSEIDSVLYYVLEN